MYKRSNRIEHRRNGKKRNKRFNEICREVIKKQRVARSNYNRIGDQKQGKHEKERKNCKRVLQREKRNFPNKILQKVEKNRL